MDEGIQAILESKGMMVVRKLVGPKEEREKITYQYVDGWVEFI